MSSELGMLLTDVVVVANRMVRLAASVTGEKVSSSHYRVLSVLSQHGPLRVGELAEHNRVSQPTMTRLIDALSEAGWIERGADAEDARVWKIAITPLGQSALDGWRERIGEALEPSFGGLSDEDRAVLRRSLDILKNGLESERKNA